ncbi:MAG: Unknown protein, partial [uncultured Sulfurovum sp.]
MLENIWIIGASQGIGLELAKTYLRKNHRVIISARKTEASKELTNLKNDYSEQVTLVNIDVTDVESVRLATQTAWNVYN